MLAIHCAICGKKEKLQDLYKENFDVKKINFATFSARRTPDRIHYRFVKCLRCGLIFSNPILEEKKITALYLKSDFHYSQESEYVGKTYTFYLEKLLPKTGRSKLKLLDVGCGNGFFLEKAQEIGIKHVYGIEPGKASVKKAPKDLQKRIKIDILRKGLFKINSFDIICCFHTLDHVTDPNEFLKITRSLLKKGGTCFFIVHNTDGLSVKLFGEKSPIFDIEHVYLFNPKTLVKIFKKNKFRKIQVIDIKNRYPLKYWFRMTPFPKKIKESILKLLKLTKTDSLPLSLSAGNIGIVAYK
ncbi:MAG: Methyltransferase type 11 [Candidatus Woesebacteria bacterium GW2011_GWA1_39_21b]|uniref:Methyltransferase type 11 n=2 Tax=Candidatus Woeseibacteriota TaxID=1752722 RepID=A0A0G0NMH9_9BACT|nr:MAG: Methyltransferase type 11 [Microgenomates group bacterium GW2011_GWC1_38_12]KKR14026.1 MAG: Methyltransferase type 11 [Candidatus Woesebacteria bacterium GW2011_GWA1_39_21b]OGM65670.1 MAG: hypothetical protein A3A52_02160 [Candidatus Woesebacteria bacterium RIFCSPLOWO2_01_FULL_39_14]